MDSGPDAPTIEDGGPDAPTIEDGARHGRGRRPRRSRRRAAVLAATVALAVLAAACGSKTGTTTTSGTPAGGSSRSGSSGTGSSRSGSSGTGSSRSGSSRSGSSRSGSSGTGSSSTGSSGPVAGQLSLSSLPGVVVSVSDSNNYGSSGSETMVRAAPDGTGHQALLRVGGQTLIGLLALSPDGSHLAYFEGTSSSAMLHVMDLANGHVTTPFRLKSKTAFIAGVAWDGNGQLLIASNVRPGASPAKQSALYEMPVTGGTMTRLTGFDDVGTPAVAPNGELVYVTSPTFSAASGYDHSVLWVAGPTGTGARPLLTSSHFIAGPAVSPDGQTVAFAVVTSNTTSHLATVPLAGGAMTSLTPAVKGRTDILPSWSPDGADVAFMSSRAGRTEGSKGNQLLDAYVMTATGTEVTPLIRYTGSKRSVDLLTWGA